MKAIDDNFDEGRAISGDWFMIRKVNDWLFGSTQFHARRSEQINFVSRDFYWTKWHDETSTKLFKRKIQIVGKSTCATSRRFCDILAINMTFFFRLLVIICLSSTLHDVLLLERESERWNFYGSGVFPVVDDVKVCFGLRNFKFNEFFLVKLSEHELNVCFQFLKITENDCSEKFLSIFHQFLLGLLWKPQKARL